MTTKESDDAIRKLIAEAVWDYQTDGCYGKFADNTNNTGMAGLVYLTCVDEAERIRVVLSPYLKDRNNADT